MKEPLARLAEARADTDRRLGDVTASGMTRAGPWMTYDVDVRFRLHPFAAYLTAHTIQCAKTLDALESDVGERSAATAS